MQRTRLSSKGQIILPKDIRDAQAWEPGTEFTVEPCANGVLLRPVALFKQTNLDEVVGCLRPARKPAKNVETGRAIDAQVKKRHDRGRY